MASKKPTVSPPNVLAVCSGNTCRSITLELLLNLILPQLGKRRHRATSRATRWEKPERMSIFATRAVVRAAMTLEIRALDMDPERVFSLAIVADGHVTRPLQDLSTLPSIEYVFAMQRSHAVGVNQELERRGEPTREIVEWDNWKGARGEIVVLGLPDDTWDLAKRKTAVDLAGDSDRAVSYEYDRQADSLAYYAAAIGARLPGA
jgi:hypothetical protein